MLNEDSLAKLATLAESNADTALFIQRTLAETYEEFIDILYRDLNAVVCKLQERKQMYHDQHEDPITMHLVDLLEARGYVATHDTKIGGHVDVVIRGNNPLFLWLGEAKRDRGSAWLSEGFQQLCLRYSDGGHNHRHGGMLIYCQKKFAARTLEKWRSHLSTMDQFEGLKLMNCDPSGLAFVSEHIHDTSGLPYIVRHLVVALYHNPTV